MTTVTARVAGGDSTPTDRLLTSALAVGPLVYLAGDSTFAVRGWQADGAGGVVQVIGSVLYGLTLLAVAARLPRTSRLRAGLVFALLVGLAGNVAYGFDAIHVALGDVSLVDRSGAATLIKPLGLCFPLALLLAGAALVRTGRRGPAALVLLGAVVFPVAHIANVPWLAVAGDAVLVLGFAGSAWGGSEQPPRPRTR